MDAIIKESSGQAGPSLRASAYLGLLYLLAGAFGLLFYIGSLSTVFYNHWIVNIGAALFCVAVWLAHRRGRVALLVFYLAYGVYVAFSLIFMRGELLRGFQNIVNGVTGETLRGDGGSTAVTLYIMTVLSILLYLIEYVLNSHGVAWLLTTLLLLAGPFFGVRHVPGAIILLVLFQAAFAALHTAAAKRRGVSLAMPVPGRGRLGSASSAIMGGAAVCILLASFLLVSFGSERLYDVIYEIEGYIYKTLAKMSGKSEDPIQGGGIAHGNNYQMGAPHLELRAYELPTDTIYLKGYSGSQYLGGEWDRSRSMEDSIFAQSAGNHPEVESSQGMRRVYSGLHFSMNSVMRRDTPLEMRNLRVRHTSNTYETRYSPYYSAFGYMGSYGYGDYQDGYSFVYYEQDEMSIDPDLILDEYSEFAYYYQLLQDAYLEEAKKEYTRVPKDLLPRLTALCEGNPQTGMEDITAFILYTLHSNATYTLTPGLTPVNQDIMENFLFERGRGYCVHFASAATLMYRLYGVPARYASGYVVSSSDFRKLGDGSYKAEVTDKSAHAWVEVYLEDYGWTPVEVSPIEDSPVAEYPGFDSASLARTMRENMWDLSVPSLEQAMDEPDERAAAEFALPELSLGRFEISGTAKTALAVAAVYSVCLLLPLLIAYRRLRRISKLGSCGPREIYSRYMQMLHFAGHLRDYDGTEADFPLLAQGISGVPAEDVRRMVEIAREAAFGPGKAADYMDEAFMRHVYMRTAVALRRELAWRRRLVFCYVRAYG